MRLIVINRHGLRQKNLIGKVTHKMAVNALDTLSIETTEGNVDKGDRLLYCDRFGAWHEFIVASVETSHGAEGVNYTIYAENSVVELRGFFLEDLRNTNASADLALQKAINKTGWRGVAENLGIANTNYYRESALSAVQKILEAYGAEMETEIRVAGSKVIDRVLHIKKRVGNDLGKRFSFTKDVTGLRRTVEEDDIITRLYGFGASVNVGEGNSRRISFAEINGGLAYVDNLEAQKKYGQNGEPFAGSVTFDKIEDKTLLLAETKKALEDLAKPRVMYEVSVVDLSQAGIAADGVGIGDVVRIRDAVLDLSLQARVLEMEEDLDNIEDTRITLGSYSRFFGEQLAGMESALARLTSKESVYDRAGYIAADGKNIAYIDTIVKNLNDQFNAGTSNMRFDPSEGITITDKATDEESTWALNLSSLGFRVANGKLANGEWNWRTFGTGEGFTADLIRAGRLEGGKVRWNLENGVLQIGDESTGSLLYDPEMGLILTPKKMTLPDELKTELKGEKGDPGSQGMPGKEGPPGKDGADGQPGEDGIGVREVLYEYASSTSAETPPASGWGRELPNVDSQIYVWTRVQTTYTDGHTETSSPQCMTSKQVQSALEEARNDAVRRVADALDYVSAADYADKAYLDGVLSNSERAILQSYEARMQAEKEAMNADWEARLQSAVSVIESELQDQQSYLWMDGGNLCLGRKGSFTALTLSPEEVGFLVRDKRKGRFNAENLLVDNVRTNILEIREAGSEKGKFQWRHRKASGEDHLTLFYVGGNDHGLS